MKEEDKDQDFNIKSNAIQSIPLTNQQPILNSPSNQTNAISSSEKQFKMQPLTLFSKDDLKAFEHQLIDKDKQISEQALSLKQKSEEMLILNQENSLLKLENKKLSLSVNSPGKVITSLTKLFKSQNESSMQQRMEDKAQLKEANEKLLLILSEKEAEICQLKESYESLLLSLNNTIYSLNAKVRDLSNDLEDVSHQLTDRSQPQEGIEDRATLLSKYNCLKDEYDQLKINFNRATSTIDRANATQLKMNQLVERNKALEERVNKLEKEYIDWLSTGKISGTPVDKLDFHVTLLNGLRSQIAFCEEDITSLEEKLKESAINHDKDSNDYKALEAKYIDSLKQIEVINSKYAQSEQHFLKGTSSLNKEIAKLLDNNFEMNKTQEELEGKLKGMFKLINQLRGDFKTLQETMTTLREKDDYDITLIEERYIVLESILQTDKAELLQQNRDLLNRLEAIQKGMNSKEDSSVFFADQELKSIMEENKLLQFRIREQERTITDKERLYEENLVYQSEIKLLKTSLAEFKELHEVMKTDLISKTAQLTNELAESRKRTSLLRSQSHMYMNPFPLQGNNPKTKPSQSGEDKKKLRNSTIEELERELFLLKKQREQEMKEHKAELEALEQESAKIKSALTALSYENEVELLRYKKEVKRLSNLLAQNKIELKNK